MFEQFCWILCFLKHKIHLQSLNIIWLLNVDHFLDLWILERRGWVIKYIIKYVTVKQNFKEAFYSTPCLHFEVWCIRNAAFLVLQDDFSRFPGWVPRHLDQGQECALILAKQMQPDVGDVPVSQQHSPSVYDAVRQCLLLCYDASQSRSYTLSHLYYSILTTIKPLFTF